MRNVLTLQIFLCLYPKIFPEVFFIYPVFSLIVKKYYFLYSIRHITTNKVVKVTNNIMRLINNTYILYIICIFLYIIPKLR